ncbi:MAG: hypothetical protein Q7T87_16115 [Polaromonas sp.]|nr:hypothetical protein [Polaromonas sp.]
MTHTAHTSTSSPSRPLAAGRHRIARLALGAAVLLLSACAAKPPVYMAAADAQQRMEAEAAATAGPALDSQATYVKLVGEMQQNDMWFASLAHIDVLEKRWGASPESTRLRADALRNSGQPAESAVFYKRLAGTPLEAAGNHGQGLLAAARDDFPTAVGFFERARTSRPADPVLLSDLGYALLRSGKIAAARVPLMQAFQLKPDNRQAQVNLALYFEAAGETARATTLMDAQQMPDATRAAIRRAARELNASLPAYTSSVVAVNAAAPVPQDGGAVPLALKASHWSDLSRVASASGAGASAAGSAGQ